MEKKVVEEMERNEQTRTKAPKRMKKGSKSPKFLIVLGVIIAIVLTIL